MERKVGTISRGIRCPIIRQGDNLAEIVSSSVLEAAESEGFELRDRDVIAWLREKGKYPSILVYRRYVKLVLLYAEKYGMMDCPLEDLPLNVPFSVDEIKNPDGLPIAKAQIFVSPDS